MEAKQEQAEATRRPSISTERRITMDKRAVLAEQVRQAHLLGPYGITATVVNSLVVFFVMRDVMPAAALHAWIALLLAASCVRIAFFLRFKVVADGPFDPVRWERVFIGGLAFMGVVWGAIGIIPLTGATLAHQVFTAFVLGGMAAGAASAYSVLARGYLAYSIPALVPVTVGFFLSRDVFHVAMGLMMVLYGILLWRIASQHYRASRNSLVLQFENRAMVAQLKSANERLGTMYGSLLQEMKAKEVAEAELRAGQEMLERKVEERTGEVRRSEALYRAIARNMPDAAVMLIDRDSRLLVAEGNLLDRIGVAREQIEGNKITALFPAAGSERIEAGLHSALEGETTSFELQLDGRTLLSRFVPLKDEEGRIMTAMNLAIDITERKQAEQERERLIQELERSNASLQQFAYAASHDLQEPLRTVSNFMELLSKKYGASLDAAAQKYISFAVNGAGRMSALISDLLAYSRVSTRVRPFQPVEMDQVVRDVLGNLKTAIEESGATVSYDTMPAVLGDQMQLMQLLQNLMSNAIKFRKPGVPPRVHISSQARGAKWVFGVHDNGIGIDARHYQRIFEIFQRLHSLDEYQGTGMGLAICKRIVERHDGRMWVDSKPGHGTSFCFTLQAA